MSSSMYKILYSMYIYIILHIYIHRVFIYIGTKGKESACSAGYLGSIPGLGRYPGEGNGNPLCTLAWRISWSEEHGRLKSMGSQTVEYDRAANTHIS